MADVTFYEKPGCINNTKQKQWLAAAGHQVISKNILTTPWTKQELTLFFGNQPIANCFNRTAPMIKSGEIVPEALTRKKALEMMIANPILIKRPLIKVGEEHVQGFNKDFIDIWIGLSPLKGNEAIVQTLQNDNLTLCPMLDKNTSCDEQANKDGVQ